MSQQPDNTMPRAETTLDRLVGRAGQLYSLPSVAMEVLELTADPKLHAHALKECIERDPALTSKLLRVVNSSLFGLSRHVSDLNQALALLGIKPLKLLVLGFSLPPNLYDGVQADLLGWYWRRTLTKAVAARAISETWHQQPGDEAFIGGLLQDLGILLLLQDLGESYVEFLQRVLALKRELAAAEREAIGFEHTELTTRLLDQWGLPPSLVQAVAGEPAAPRPLAETLRLAELAAQFLADGRPEALHHLVAETGQQDQPGRQAAEEMVSALEEKVQQLAEVLCLQLPAGQSCQELLRQAHRRLAGVAEEVAGDLIEAPSAADGVQAQSRLLRQTCRNLARAAEGSRHHHPPGRTDEGAPRPPGVAAGGATAHPVPPPAGVPAPAATMASRCSAPSETTPGLASILARSVATCRQARCPLSLLLVEPESSDDPFSGGPHVFTRWLQQLESACRNLDHPHLICEPFQQAGFALILPDCDRLQAVQLGHALMAHVHPRAGAPSVDRSAMTISLGVATVSLPPKNFPPDELLKAAQRCLYGSHASGGGVVKSIEI